MPAHDWTRVEDGIFHAFHLAWIAELQRLFNNGILPFDFYALAAQVNDRAADILADADRESYTSRQRSLTIRHTSGHRVVALVEIISAGNKASEYAWQSFLDKALAALKQGIHLLLIDLYPSTARDPQGVHGSLWGCLTGEPYTPPDDAPLTQAAYSSGPVKTAYVEPIAVGQQLPAMPLFLTPDGYIEAPLEATYQAAYAGVPRFYRNALERAVS
jgi:hypothetical protein